MPNAFERCGSAVRQASFVMLSFLALAASGCLHFKRETCVITMNPKTNQAFVLLVYEGLDVSGKSKNDLQKAKEELKEAFADSKRFYLGAPLLGLQVELGSDGASKFSDEQRKLAAFLHRYLTLHRGVFFLSKTGELCAYQTVTIRDIDKFVTACNALTSQALLQYYAEPKSPPNRKERSDADKAVDQLVQRAARDGHVWFRFQAGRMSLILPGSPEVYKSAKRDILVDLMLSATNLEEFRDAVPPLSKKIESVTAPKDPASAKLEVVRKILSGIDDSARYLSEIPLSIDQRRDNLTISLGYGDGEPIRFPFPLDKTNDSSQAGELTKYARTLGVELRADLTVNKIITDFEKEHPPSGIPR